MIWKYNTIKAPCCHNQPNSIQTFTTLVPYQTVGILEDYDMLDLVLEKLRPLGFVGSCGVSIERHGIISKERINDILMTLKQELK